MRSDTIMVRGGDGVKDVRVAKMRMKVKERGDLEAGVLDEEISGDLERNELVKGERGRGRWVRSCSMTGERPNVGNMKQTERGRHTVEAAAGTARRTAMSGPNMFKVSSMP
jgi:hypothetical protein